MIQGVAKREKKTLFQDFFLSSFPFQTLFFLFLTFHTTNGFIKVTWLFTYLLQNHCLLALSSYLFVLYNLVLYNLVTFFKHFSCTIFVSPLWPLLSFLFRRISWPESKVAVNRQQQVNNSISLVVSFLQVM